MLTSANTSSPEAFTGAFGIIQSQPDERTSVVALEGELDLGRAPSLKWALVDAVDAGYKQLVVDLSRCQVHGLDGARRAGRRQQEPRRRRPHGDRLREHQRAEDLRAVGDGRRVRDLPDARSGARPRPRDTPRGSGERRRAAHGQPRNPADARRASITARGCRDRRRLLRARARLAADGAGRQRQRLDDGAPPRPPKPPSRLHGKRAERTAQAEGAPVAPAVTAPPAPLPGELPAAGHGRHARAIQPPGPGPRRRTGPQGRGRSGTRPQARPGTGTRRSRGTAQRGERPAGGKQAAAVSADESTLGAEALARKQKKGGKGKEKGGKEKGGKEKRQRIDTPRADRARARWGIVGRRVIARDDGSQRRRSLAVVAHGESRLRHRAGFDHLRHARRQVARRHRCARTAHGAQPAQRRARTAASTAGRFCRRDAAATLLAPAAASKRRRARAREQRTSTPTQALRNRRSSKRSRGSSASCRPPCAS